MSVCSFAALPTRRCCCYTMDLFLALLVLTLVWQPVRGAYYISYETPRDYAEGESVRFKVNKHTSPETLSSIDFPYLAVCWNNGNKRLSQPTIWKRSMEALHADSFYSDTSIELRMKQNAYCQHRCSVSLSDLSSSLKQQLLDYGQNYWVDEMPVALRTEDDETVSVLYWHNLPMATRGGTDDHERTVGKQVLSTRANSRFRNTTRDQIFVYNHYNFIIYYEPVKDNKYRVLRTLVEPFSILRNTINGTAVSPVASCASQVHTTYDMLWNVTPQPAEGTVKYTYDVIWKQASDASIGHVTFKSRWDVFLTMDEAQPLVVKFLGVFVSIIICCILLGSLWTWVMRDLSYKPIALQVEDEDFADDELAKAELQMWPLSTRVFFPPRAAPILFCVSCGTGAHLLVTGFIFCVLFRIGIVSQALWANILTPAVVLYTLFSGLGGYVTGRLVGMFHYTLDDAMRASLMTSTGYPVLGVLVTYLVYDTFSGSMSPHFEVVKQSLPLLVILFFCIIPLTLAGGWYGFRNGPLTDFPVSEGHAGYHDLDLQETRDGQGAEQVENRETTWCGKGCYIPKLLLIGGILPVLGVFVAYAYGVAGPVFVGFYTDASSFLIASFSLFVASSSAVSMLLFYRQIRSTNYAWWWASFASAGSSGIYLFLLTMTWLLFNLSVGDLSGRVWALYVLWFAYVSLGAAFMTGFAGVAATIWFTRVLYRSTKQRNE